MQFARDHFFFAIIFLCRLIALLGLVYELNPDCRSA